MKKYILTLAIFACSTALFSQTTSEEYNYLTKDYVAHRNDAGFELMKGYAIENLYFNDENGTSITIQKFVKGEAKTPVAFLLAFKKGKNPTEFICIPHPKTTAADVNSAYWKSLESNNSPEKYQYVVHTLGRYLAW